jgi:hypothetical protein
MSCAASQYLEILIDHSQRPPSLGEYRIIFHKNGEYCRQIILDDELVIVEEGKDVRCEAGDDWYLNYYAPPQTGAVYVNEKDLTRECYYLDGKLHRLNGPAIESYNVAGGRAWVRWWYFHGEFHRTDGPAYEDARGFLGWYLHDQQMTKEEWECAKIKDLVI